MADMFAFGANMLGGVFGNILNYESQRNTNQANLKAVRETNALNESLTRESWSREDNAIQRRSADMAAAGINPVLAAGSPAASSSAAHMEAPRRQAPQVDFSFIADSVRLQDELKNSAKNRQLIDTEIAGKQQEQRFFAEQHDWSRSEEVRRQEQHKWSANAEGRSQKAESRVQQVHEQALRNVEADIKQKGIDYPLSQQQQKLNDIGLTDAQVRSMMLQVESEFHKAGIMADLADKSLQAQIKEIALEVATHDRDIVLRSPSHSSSLGNRDIVK
jgi:rRNA maturation endonuclease Nob1